MTGSVTFSFSTADLSALGLPWLWPLFWCYVVFALITLGYYFRLPRSRGLLGALLRALIFAALWPAYWLVIIGPIDTIHILSEAIGRIRTELLFAYYTLGLIFVPAYQLYLNWDRCEGLESCSWTVIKAFLTGLVWPILLVFKIVSN